jgi:hypothetical protein
MKMLTGLLFALLTLSSHAGNPYPRVPDLTITPGALCETPDRLRYPEQIAYCERDVSSWTKELVFIEYRKLGFSLSGERSRYKVDHFIPLCAGGSNDLANLWPQYDTISKLTDPLEPLACEVLSKGKVTQKDLVDLVMKAKLNTKEVPRIMQQLSRLNQ